MYAACGAVGQIFIFITLAKFGSLILIMVTVTRKMMSMLISVFLFGHELTNGQWLALILVFGGIGFEAYYKLQQDLQKKKN
jgi:UDP-galactose transporter B1